MIPENAFFATLFSKYIVIGEKNSTVHELLLETTEFMQTELAAGILGVHITFDRGDYFSKGFKTGAHVETQHIVIHRCIEGEVQLHFEQAPTDAHAFKMALQHLVVLLNGFVAERKLSRLSYEHGERIKELQGINKTTNAFKQSKSLHEALLEICNFIPDAMQYPEHTAARISYDHQHYLSKHFQETSWVLKQRFDTPDKKAGTIEIFYLKEFPEEYKGPFLEEELNLISNLAALITGMITERSMQTLIVQNTERLKELQGINHTRSIISEGKPINETLQKICSILPQAWQYPQFTCARISFDGEAYESRHFNETRWYQQENFVTFDNKKGSVEIYYLKEFPACDEGPFMHEERNLIVNIASLICGYLNDAKGRLISNKFLVKKEVELKPEEYRQSLISSKQPLHNFFNKQTLEKYIYLDMMKYKVKEILFVSNLYDAFSLEKEDSFFEKFMGSIYQYSLFSLPRITGVASHEQAMELLETTQFDLVVLMVGIDIQAPIELSKQIRERRNELPIYVLLNQRSNISFFEDLVATTSSFNKLFIWNGDSQIFFAMVKSLEDRVNVENDTKIGLVRAILLIEDSAQYYSKYLPMLYSIIFDQVKELISELEMNELDKISKIRSRPKLLWAQNYEEATFLYNKYKEFLICVISDAEFERGGVMDKSAGISFLQHVRSKDYNLPLLMQSSDSKYAHQVQPIKARFINKTSERLLKEMKNFVVHHFGYGEFVFRNAQGEPVATAKTLREFETLIREISDESLAYHAQQNQFSIWLMGRGEVELATKLNPIQVRDFHSVKDLRKMICHVFDQYRQVKKRGRILTFDETAKLDEKNIVSLAAGSFGGKGRGLAFVNTLINNLDFSRFTNRINIRTPKTAIIGTDEFEYFMDNNLQHDNLFAKGISYAEIKQLFVKGKLSDELRKKLMIFLDQITCPIAVRSSSIFEDSLTQPFAGIFDTYIIPNNHRDLMVRLHDLETAIKLVYASVYGDQVKAFYKTINHKIEEEKMGIVLQELVGHAYDGYYYPHISGVAQSYNYYPVAHMKPEEGFAVCAVGLGFYIVDGRRSFRFSPQYPKTDMFTNKDQIKSSQLEFFAVDLNRSGIDYITHGEHASLITMPMEVSEKHGTLKHCVSVYDAANDKMEPGLSASGPRIVNFANILKYDYIPLAETISVMLDTVKEAMGAPVEIEFAVDLTPDEHGLASFYLLQIKPLTGSMIVENIAKTVDETMQELIYTSTSVGNGKLENITDIIYVDIDKFDKLRTIEMVKEIEELNKRMERDDRQYILIGPGRWGTSDRFLGIPVVWSQISKAKVIIEISLSDFPLDASLGSHFFHNITTMNVGYFAINNYSNKDFIHWDLLKEQKVIRETEFFKHIRCSHPLSVFMNGKKREASIFIKQKDHE